jgi:hypothetical protein
MTEIWLVKPFTNPTICRFGGRKGIGWTWSSWNGVAGAIENELMTHDIQLC